MALLDLGLGRHTKPGISLFAFAHKAFETHRQRTALKRLDDAALMDIGLTRAEADAEAARPLWDVPANWRC